MTDKLEKIIEKAWKDEAFKEKLKKDPKAALAELNVAPPDDLNIQVHEDTEKTMHLVIPRDPSKSQLRDEDLDAVSGGIDWCQNTASWCSC